jgi:hypothetical protein
VHTCDVLVVVELEKDEYCSGFLDLPFGCKVIENCGEKILIRAKMKCETDAVA